MKVSLDSSLVLKYTLYIMMNLTVVKNRVGPVLGRHPWVFSGALRQIPDGIESGTPIQLVDETGRFLAAGYFNSYSQIAVRVWGWTDGEEVDEDFFARRIQTAYDLRQRLVLNKKTDSCRIVNSESDLLPGLVVDKYGDYLVVQFHNLGIDKWKKEIVIALKKVIKPKGIYERSDVGNRAKEGGEVASGLLMGKVPERVEILENGYKFLVDIAGGQKTGFFLDQRDKRSALQKYCAGKKVLNCYSYTGGFSVYALAAGAKHVVSVDASEPALEIAEANCSLNGFKAKQSEFVCADVREYLLGLINKDETLGAGDFDVIVLDPPAFIKDRRKIHEGMQGYKKINELAMRLLPQGGILVSCSCSQHLSMLDFRHVVSEAAGRAGRTVRIVETLTHGIDHPQLVAFTEGEYLKCLFALVD